MTETSQPGRASRVLRIALAFSLALNLLVLGVVIGAWFRFGGPDARAHTGNHGAVFFREMPRPARAELRAALRERGHARRRTDHAPLLRALTAEPFEPEQVLAAMQDRNRSSEARRAELARIWVGQLAAMSADDRKAYAARVEEALERRGKPRKP